MSTLTAINSTRRRSSQPLRDTDYADRLSVATVGIVALDRVAANLAADGHRVIAHSVNTARAAALKARDV